jgi:hypothetical protein
MIAAVGWASQSATNSKACFTESGVGKNLGAGCQPQESKQHNPRKPNGFGSRESVFQPGSCRFVKRRILVDRINKQIYVWGDHRWSGLFSFRTISLSSSSAASARAFLKSSRSDPRWYVGWTNRDLAAGACEERPARTASFRTRSKSTLRSRARCFSKASTSGSRCTWVSTAPVYQGGDVRDVGAAYRARSWAVEHSAPKFQ